jgi:hypothetical protein
MSRFEHIMAGWWRFVLCFNVAVFLLSFGLAPVQSGTFRYDKWSVYGFLERHDFSYAIWFVAASVCLSAGAYQLARGIARTDANTNEIPDESDFVIHSPRRDARRSSAEAGE